MSKLILSSEQRNERASINENLTKNYGEFGWSDETLKERKSSSSLQTSVIDSFKSFSQTCSSSVVVLRIGDDDPNDPPAVQGECLLLRLSFVISYFS
jgi:hypothetical protein